MPTVKERRASKLLKIPGWCLPIRVEISKDWQKTVERSKPYWRLWLCFLETLSRSWLIIVSNELPLDHESYAEASPVKNRSDLPFMAIFVDMCQESRLRVPCQQGCVVKGLACRKRLNLVIDHYVKANEKDLEALRRCHGRKGTWPTVGPFFLASVANRRNVF